VIEDATGFRFHHDLTRELVLEDLYPARAGLLNLRAAKARADTPILAANHYWAAKDLLEQDDATQAGQAFLHVASVHAVGNDLEVGLQWFDRALQMARDVGQKIQILTDKARMLKFYRRYEEMDQVLTLAETLNDQTNPVRTVQVLNTRASYVIGRSSDVETTLELSQKALSILDQHPTIDHRAERADALSNMGAAFQTINDVEQARSKIEQALELHRQIGNQIRIGESLRVLGWSLSRMADPKAFEVIQEEIDLWTKLGNMQSIVFAHNDLGVHWFNVGDYNKAEEVLNQVISLSEQYGIEKVPSGTYNNLGAVYFMRQDFKNAEHAYQKAFEGVRLEHDALRTALILANLAEVSLYTHRPAAAEAFIVQGRLALRNTPHDAKLADLAWLEGEVHVLQNNLLQAQGCFLESQQLAQKSQRKSRLAQALARLARLNADLELAQQAFILLEVPATIAAIQAIQGQPEAALETIRSLNDSYEEYRLLVDLEHLTGNTQFTVLAEEVRMVFRAV
jgi:tetratricopeptide (TPR) repeat protein